MQDSLYTGSHRELFQIFLKLVDDPNQTTALLNLTAWNDVRSLLSIGGGQGVVEAALLRNAPQAKVWYLDPSPEQCQAFRQHMKKAQLLDRVKDVAQTTFQDYNTRQTFDRIVSMFSWFFMGADKRWLTKLLDLLNPNGTACLVLPNTESIEVDFNRSLSPDEQMTLAGDKVMNTLKTLDCTVTQHTYTKWLAIDDLFDGELLSHASLAFAGFIAMRPIATFTSEEKEQIIELLNARREAQGVPLRWEVILIEHGSG